MAKASPFKKKKLFKTEFNQLRQAEDEQGGR